MTEEPQPLFLPPVAGAGAGAFSVHFAYSVTLPVTVSEAKSQALLQAASLYQPPKV